MKEDTGTVKNYDVLIIGAGPGGCSCAIALKDTGLRVAIIDKATFPRDKVCGELMHRKAVETLESLLPGFEKTFKQFPKTLVLKHTQINYKGRMIKFDWKNESYTCPRMDLDNFLLGQVKEHTPTDVFTSTQPDKITVTNDGVTLTIKGSTTVFTGEIIIGADGANSIVAKQLTERTLDRKHYLGAVRAYYSNVKDTKPDVSEVFFSPKFGLNYLWVFPVEGGKVNVGFGLLSQNIADQKINLKEAFYKYFKDSPELSAKFKDAIQEGPLEGFGVPLGSSIGAPSGNRFMLLGDAASLSNPLSGTGIGNAVLSGKLAANQVKTCFAIGDFSATPMLQYDDELQKAIVNDLVASYKVQRSLSKMPFILDVVFWLGKYEKVKKYIQSMV